MLWQVSLSIAGQVHEKLMSIWFFNNNKLSNEPLACCCICINQKVDMSVCLLIMKISQWAGKNCFVYCKINTNCTYKEWTIWFDEKVPGSAQVPKKITDTSTTSEFHGYLVSLKKACNLMHTPSVRTKIPYCLKGLKRKGIPMLNHPAPLRSKMLHPLHKPCRPVQ